MRVSGDGRGFPVRRVTTYEIPERPFRGSRPWMYAIGASMSGAGSGGTTIGEGQEIPKVVAERRTREGG